MAYYILDHNNNKIEVTDQVLTALVEQIKCCVSGTPYKLAFVTQAKYNELEAAGLVQANTIYEIIDDTTADDLDEQLKENKRKLEEHTNKLNGINGGWAFIGNVDKQTIGSLEIDGFDFFNINSTGLYLVQVKGYHLTSSDIYYIYNILISVESLEVETKADFYDVYTGERYNVKYTPTGFINDYQIEVQHGQLKNTTYNFTIERAKLLMKY